MYSISNNNKEFIICMCTILVKNVDKSIYKRIDIHKGRRVELVSIPRHSARARDVIPDKMFKPAGHIAGSSKGTYQFAEVFLIKDGIPQEEVTTAEIYEEGWARQIGIKPNVRHVIEWDNGAQISLGWNDVFRFLDAKNCERNEQDFIVLTHSQYYKKHSWSSQYFDKILKNTDLNTLKCALETEEWNRRRGDIIMQREREKNIQTLKHEIEKRELKFI
jgi:hypothetical protein